MDEDLITKHDETYKQAFDLIRGEVFLDGMDPLPIPGFFLERKLNRAVLGFHRIAVGECSRGVSTHGIK